MWIPSSNRNVLSNRSRTYLLLFYPSVKLWRKLAQIQQKVQAVIILAQHSGTSLLLRESSCNILWHCIHCSQISGIRFPFSMSHVLLPVWDTVSPNLPVLHSLLQVHILCQIKVKNRILSCFYSHYSQSSSTYFIRSMV